MRRIWIGLAAAGVLVLGCSKINNLLFPAPQTQESSAAPSPDISNFAQSNLAGQWHVFYSWGCGSYSETTWILNPDGTFYAPEVNRGGKWKVEGRSFVLTFLYDPFVIYSGEADFSEETMEGTMAGNEGSRGCWHARKEASAG